MKNLTRWAPALVIVAASANVAWANGNERTETLVVTFYVSDQAEVSRNVLEQAEERITPIFSRIGINVVWNTGQSRRREEASSPASFEDDGLHVAVLIPSAVAAEQMHRPERVFGYVPRVSPEVAGRVAYVFYHRAERLARSKNVDLATVLAHVLAHEIGHMLLPYDSHSPTGIMQGKWDLPQLRHPERGALSFTEDQVKLIRATLSAARVRSERALSVAHHENPATLRAWPVDAAGLVIEPRNLPPAVRVHPERDRPSIILHCRAPRMSIRFRLLTEADVRAVISMGDLIDSMASALEILNRCMLQRVVAPRGDIHPECSERCPQE